MAKTAISTLISRIKQKADYNITDTDLDSFVVDEINDSLKLIKQWLFDNGILKDISKSSSIKTVEDQEYLDLNVARIVGDVASFTGIADDKIKVIIDGTTYDNISIATATTIALVASAINTAVSATVATVSDDGYLVITSPTSGVSSSVTIADGTTTGQTVVGDLFSVATERTQTAIYDVDEIISLTERVNGNPIRQISYDELKEIYTDPTAAYNTVPDVYARLVDKLYFGPTPSDNKFLYVDYIMQITEVSSGSTCPLDNKYDPLIKALSVKGLASFLDPANTASIASCNRDIEFYTKQLITGAARNYGRSNSTASRKPEIPYFAPRKVVN